MVHHPDAERGHPRYPQFDVFQDSLPADRLLHQREEGRHNGTHVGRCRRSAEFCNVKYIQPCEVSDPYHLLSCGDDSNQLGTDAFRLYHAADDRHSARSGGPQTQTAESSGAGTFRFHTFQYRGNDRWLADSEGFQCREADGTQFLSRDAGSLPYTQLDVATICAGAPYERVSWHTCRGDNPLVRRHDHSFRQ